MEVKMLMVCYSFLEHCHIKIIYHRNGDVDSYLTRKELNEIKNHPLDVVSPYRDTQRQVSKNDFYTFVQYVQFDLKKTCQSMSFNLLIAKLFSLNFHPLEVVSRWRDPQLQVCENYLDLTK